MTGDGVPIVEVFSQSHCAACKRVAHFLEERGVPYVLRDVGRDAQALEELTKRGYMATPVTRVDDVWVSGFKPRTLTRLIGKRSKV